MEKITKIDEDISSYNDELQIEANKINFDPLCEFKLNKNHIKEIPWDTFHYPGVYLFEIKNNNTYDNFESWVTNFRDKWMDSKYVKCFTPNLTKKRVKEHNSLNEWIPIYIGKSKNIEGRVHEHIFKDLSKTTFALKLNSRDNLYEETFRLSIININLRNYNSLMPLVESTLREKINPILGRQ